MNPTQTVRGLPRRTPPAAAVLFSLLFASALPLAAEDPAAAPAPAPAPASASTPAPDKAPAEEKAIVLSKFTVAADSADRYRAADAISAQRVRAPLLETPSSVSVITRDMMDDLAPNRVFDATRYIAGVQEGRGLNFQDRTIIRGFETQNGARTVDSFLQSADSDNVEESVIDRVEIAKGPNSILSPAGAPGGSLNVITKSPLYSAQRFLTAEVGLFDAQKVTLDMSGPFSAGSPFAYRLVGSYQNTERYWGSASKLKGSAIAPMLSWRIGDRSMLTVKVIAAEHWVFRDPLFIISPFTTASTYDPQLMPGLDPSGVNGVQPWSHVGTHSADAFVTFTTSFNEHLNLRVAGNGRYYHEDSDQDFINAPNFANRYNPYTGDLTQDYTWALANASLPHNAITNPYVATYSQWLNPASVSNRGNIQDTERHTANFQVDLAGNYKIGEVSSQTIVGAAYSRQYAYSRNVDGTLPNINIFAPVYAYPVYPPYPTNNSGSGTSYTNTYLYLNERLGFFNDRLFITGGLMHYKTDSKRWNADTGVYSGFLDDDKNLPSYAILYKVRDNASIYYSHSTNANAAIPGLNLQPLWQQGKQDEFGVKTEFFDKRLSFNAAYFEIAQTNVTVPNPAYQTDPTQPQTLVSDLSNAGYELEAMGRVSDNASIVATFAHLNMRDALGRMVRGVADNTAAFLFNYRVTDGTAKGLSFDFGVTWTSKRAGDSPTDGGNFTQLGIVKNVSFYLKPQYTTTLGLNYRWSKMLSTRLTLDNLFDQKDYISVAGGRVTGTGLYTQPGFNARLAVTVNF